MSSGRSQRRQLDPDDVDAVKEILAERALVDHAANERFVAAMMRTSTSIPTRPADALERALARTQQFHLHRQRHLADLVEKQRAAMCLLEAALALPHRAGKGAFLVAEEFAFEEVFG